MKNNIITKVCFRCDKDQAITEYYKHKQMADGHLNKCKSCTKSDSVKRHHEKNKDTEWVKAERERSKEKYHRLNYLERSKELNKNKPWKTSSKYKNLNRKFKIVKGCEIHHWNYNDKYLEDVIVMETKSHRNWHRFLTLDENRLIFIGNNGEVLDTKQKHIDYCLSLYPTLIQDI